MAKRFQRRRCLNIVNGQRQRRTPEHWYTISSPFEPHGSGELIIQIVTEHELLFIEYKIQIETRDKKKINKNKKKK